MDLNGSALFSKAAQVCRQSRHFIKGRDGIEGCDHLALTDFMGDHNDLCTGLTGIELND